MALAAVSFDVERVRSALPETLQARIHSGRELLRRRAQIHRETPLSTGLAPLDRLLGGGLERGALTELSGSRSSGRFAVALATLATATQGGEAAALVDLGGQLDPAAAREAGCDLERFLWAQAANLKQVLAAGEALLQAGFPLVVLDLGHPPVPGGRGQESAWTRLARAAEAQRAALFVSAPYRVSGTAAACVLAARATRATWAGKGREPRMLAGVRTAVTLQKARLQADEQKTCVLEWTIEPVAIGPATKKTAAASASSHRESPAKAQQEPSAGSNLRQRTDLADHDTPIPPLPDRAGGGKPRESRMPKTTLERYEQERLRQ